MTGSNKFNHCGSGKQQANNFRSKPSCPICTQVGRPQSGHLLSTCPFLPESDKFVTRTRVVQTIEDLERDDYYYEDEYSDHPTDFQQQQIISASYSDEDDSEIVLINCAETKRV